VLLNFVGEFGRGGGFIFAGHIKGFAKTRKNNETATMGVTVCLTVYSVCLLFSKNRWKS